MAQITLYLDDQTAQRIKRAARRQKISLSKWVAQRLEDRSNTKWPSRYDKLFGSLADSSFERPEQGNTEDDVGEPEL